MLRSCSTSLWQYDIAYCIVHGVAYLAHRCLSPVLPFPCFYRAFIIEAERHPNVRGVLNRMGQAINIFSVRVSVRMAGHATAKVRCHPLLVLPLFYILHYRIIIMAIGRSVCRRRGTLPGGALNEAPVSRIAVVSSTWSRSRERALTPPYPWIFTIL